MPVTILVVDDDANQREICSAILRHHGYHVLYAGKGREGVRMAQETLPDVILMDIRMPVLGGIPTLHALKQDAITAHIPVIAITADLFQWSRSALLRQGFRGYIAKPCRPREILRTVQQFIGSTAIAAD